MVRIDNYGEENDLYINEKQQQLQDLSYMQMHMQMQQQQQLHRKNSFAGMIRESHDRQNLYQQHRLRVQNAKSVINSALPQRKVPAEPQKPLTFIDLISSMRRYGYTRTFTKPPETRQGRARLSRFYFPGEHCSHCINSSMSTSTCTTSSSDISALGCSPTKNLKKCKKVKTNSSVSLKSSDSYRDGGIPEYVLRRYEHLNFAGDRTLLRRLLRPKIYFDMIVKGVRPLGRLVIQLYTEACPEVVVEFVRACSANRTDRLNITRLFPPMWFEGELALDDNKTLTMPNMDHDTSVLNHGCSAGILSFPSRYTRGSKRRSLSFSISFKPLNCLNGKRIAFGKVKRGTWILDAIQEYVSYNGKPVKEIVVTKCGLLN